MKQIVCLLLLMFFGVEAFSQCSIENYQWITTSYEDPDTKIDMYFPLIFNLGRDTIVIRNVAREKYEEKVKYKILSSECIWDADTLNGQASYQVYIISSGKSATLKLFSKVGKGKISILIDGINEYSPVFDVQRIVRKN